MELTYVCKHCGGKSKMPAEQLADMEKIVCPLCGKSSGNEAASGAEVERFDPTLNVEQEQAATYDGPANGILLLAGAGCGKTRTMIARALYLLKVKKVHPERMAMLTFTRRAAKEIEDRLAQELPGVERRVSIGTFHRFCLNILHRNARFFGLEQVKILDRGDQEIILRRIRGKLRASFGEVGDKEGVVPNERNMAGVFSYVNNCRVGIQTYYDRFPSQHPETADLMEQAHREYTAYKKDNGYLDFDDILTVTAEKLETDAELKRIVQNSLDQILVDEMQDTSPVQWDILKALYPAVQLFCVGDDAQSIYSFRGADFESIHHFCEVLPNSVKLKLTENYRSTQEILDIANMLLADSPLGYDKELRAHKGAGGVRPRMYEFYSDDDEADFVVSSISRKLEEGVPAKEIMVLLRGTMNGRMVEYGLRRYGIAYRVIGGVGFLQSAHVKDVVAAFEALTTERNELSWIRFLMLLPHIGAKTAEKLYASAAQQPTLQDSIRAVAKALAGKLPDTARFLEHFDGTLRPDLALGEILDFLDRSELLSMKYDHWKERRRDLEVLLEISARYQTAVEFLEAFKLDPDAEVRETDGQADENCVTLITVHSAKGTEADVCYILKVQPGNYPHYRSNEQQMEEDRRVLYVAMTRARKELYLTATEGEGYSCYYSDVTFLTDEMKELLRPPRRRRR